VRLSDDDIGLILRRLIGLGIAIAVLTLAGSAAFSLSEHVSFWQGFVWSLDTIATVGSIQAPTDTGGEVTKVVLIVFGVGTLFYALVTFCELVVTGLLSGLLRERRERRMIDSLADHYVICGFGRVGRQAARDLSTAHAPFVVVDSSAEAHEAAHRAGVPFIEGDPSDDDVLLAAGIERARGVIACVDSDPQNVFITLTVRQVCPEVLIVARASEEHTEAKLKQAGADRVISPYKTSGAEMARLALHPQVYGAVDVSADYRMEEIEVPEGCAAAGRSIEEIRGAALIVALRRADGRLEPQPPPGARLAVGDTVVALGTAQALDRLEGVFEPDEARAS
jgi:voltage-gated potassium channel